VLRNENTAHLVLEMHVVIERRVHLLDEFGEALAFFLAHPRDAHSSRNPRLIPRELERLLDGLGCDRRDLGVSARVHRHEPETLEAL